MASRRNVLWTTGAAGLISICGCSDLNQDYIDIRVVNQRDKQIEMEIQLTSSNEVYNKEFTIQAGESETQAEAVPPKEYDVEISVTGCPQHTGKLGPMGCQDPIAIITVEDNCVVDIGGKNCD